MMRMMAAVIAAAILFAVSPAYCSTYYVATTGDDTAGDGSIGLPWKTIPKAVGVAVTGDTIYIRGGTYTYTTTISISKSGTASARYYLFGYPGERPILDFSSMSEASSNRGIALSGSYWHIKNLDIYKAGDNGMNISSSNNIIEFCAFYENRDTGLQIGGGGANNQIINCDSYYNCDSDMGDADGFAPKLDVGTGNYFYGCRAWQNSDDAYDGYLRGADNVTTTYENCWAFKAGYLKDGSTGSGNGNGFKMGGSDDKLLKHNVILRNCLAFNNLAKGFDQNSDKGLMELYNCTAFSNVGYNWSIATTGATSTVTNGVSAGTGSGVNLGSFVVQTTNSWQSPFVVTNADFVSVDPAAAYGPRQADGSLPDIGFMHLAAGSDLIDGGTDVGLPYNGTKPDLGCYEYGVVNDTTAPTPNPMTWQTVPYAASTTTVTMVATTASDASGVEYYFACTAGGGHDSAWQNSISYTDTGLNAGVTYTYRVIARDKSTNHNETGWSPEASATPEADTTAPAPNPMTWQTVPYATGPTAIAMTATTASDVSGVQYYFANLSVSGHDSGWQSGTTYTDAGLTPGATYTYTVKARDASPAANETAWSGNASATTPVVDVIPPTPDPMTWQLYPYALGASSITMTASTASDASGVQYYFDCVSGGGHDSGWQSSPTYTDTGLIVNTTYQYAVQARDTSSNNNTTGWSSTRAATTYAVGGTTQYQAEDQTWNSGTATETTNAGYTGASYVNTNNAVGSWIQWAVTVPSSGSCTIGIRFANQPAANRPMSIMVNGTIVIASFDFLTTGAWTTWTINSTALSLNAGSNTIRLTSLTSNGAPNLDRMDVTAPVSDSTAPTPNPMEWAIVPTATSYDTIAMTAWTAGDASGVEYFFANITDPNHNSAWQASATYTDIGLANNTQYTYSVIARDQSSSHNETGWSSQLSATTLRYVCTSTIAADISGDCQVDFLDLALIGNTWVDDTTGWTNLAQFASDWLMCNRNPAGECWQ